MDKLCKNLAPYSVSTVKDVPASVFIKAFAKHLKTLGKLGYPEWVDIVKTGAAKELAPYDPDWFYIRAAAVLRHLYMRPNCGVGAFRKVFSSKKRRGVAPGISCKASGKIVRHILKQFREMEFIEKADEKKPGRRLTKKGQSALDTIARQCEKVE